MGTVVVKINNEYYETENDMNNLLQYIAAKGNNRDKEILLTKKGKGVSSKPVKAARQMQAVQRHYGKDQQRRMYHLIISFPRKVRGKKAVKNVARDIADMLFESY